MNYQEDYHPGGKITDDRGFMWTIMHTWYFEDYLCMSLRGTFFPDVMGGHRVRLLELQQV